jgi:hypothetical protein
MRAVQVTRSGGPEVRTRPARAPTSARATSGVRPDRGQRTTSTGPTSSTKRQNATLLGSALRAPGLPGTRTGAGGYPPSVQASERRAGERGASPGRWSASRVPETGQDRMNSSRSALIVSACVVGIPCGKPA